MAQRIMGQGDLMGLVNKIIELQSKIGKEELEAQQKKLMEGDFTLDDFRKQFSLLAGGNMKDMIGRMPGMSEMIPEGEDPENAMKRVQGMIDSMTKKERQNPDVIDLSRRRRIAAGSGTEPHEIKQFLTQFEQVRTLMRSLKTMSIWEKLSTFRNLGKMGAMLPGGPGLKTKGDTGHRKTPKERAEDRKKKRKQDKKRGKG
jgi:signal recognition particle subunit SRP54